MVESDAYIPSRAKPKINIAPTFVSASASPFDAAGTEEPNVSAPEVHKRARTSSYSYSSGWDIRFAVGLVLAIMLVNTALVILFSADTTPSPDTLSPSAGPTSADEVAPYTTSVPLTRPVRTARDLALDAPAGSTTEVYITPVQRQLLLRQLNGVTTAPDDAIDAGNQP